MKLAIVGTSVNMTENEDRDIRQTIALILKDYVPSETTIITGGAKGVDSIASEVGLPLMFAIKPILPLGIGWEFYKSRNIQIAEECDQLICISLPVHSEKCYHHIEPQNHQKTAGCWTLKVAKKIGKPTQLIVLPAR